uniref:Reverse transcriptase domain-containing protein n=1 Tax=Macrostomum lignano TaxID=282301 RepID=A0A1I8HI55_9PLAT
MRSMKSCPAAATSKYAGANNALWLSLPGKTDNQQQQQQDAPPAFDGEAIDRVIQPTLRLDFQTNNNKNESHSAAAAASKSSSVSGCLWMNSPSPEAESDADASTFGSIARAVTRIDSTLPASHKGKVARRVAFDASPSDATQTNNSRRGSRWAADRSDVSSGSSGDYEIVSDLTEINSLENTSALARGADAMVKSALSRQTEIIDTSKLVEEGKVRLRALLNMKFNELDKGTVDTNFLLIKAHEHPTQKIIDRWRNVDYGFSYNDQVKMKKLIEDYRNNAVKKKEKKGEESEPHYPDFIRFTVRFRKENSEKRWNDYLAFRKKQKKLTGKKGAGPVPKPNDKYVFAFQDIWSFCIAVYARPWATVRDIIDPVFARIGLDRRADFLFTIGCFNYDKRAGKAKIMGVPNLAEELTTREIASDLYKKNCTEIYVNDNRCDMFRIFPDYYTRNKGYMLKEKTKGKKKKKGKDAKGAGPKNKSNTDAVAAAVVPDVAKTEDAFEATSPKSPSTRRLSVVEETSRESMS